MTNDEFRQLIEFLGARFETIDQHFETVDQHFETVDQHFKTVARRFEAVDQRFDAVEAHLTRHDHEFTAVSRRFEAAAETAAERHHEVLDHLDAIYHRLERLEQEQLVTHAQLGRLEAGHAGEPQERERLERHLAELAGEMTRLRARVDALERRLPR